MKIYILKDQVYSCLTELLNDKDDTYPQIIGRDIDDSLYLYENENLIKLVNMYDIHNGAIKPNNYCTFSRYPDSAADFVMRWDTSLVACARLGAHHGVDNQYGVRICDHTADGTTCHFSDEILRYVLRIFS